MLIQGASIDYPYFSVCIPQYNRTSFLIAACKSLAAQSLRDFEVCISDGGSTDGRRSELLEMLDAAGLSYRYAARDTTTRYDANLRSAISLARGKYCFLLGNDDWVHPDALNRVKVTIESLGPAGVLIPDFEDYATGRRALRIRTTANFGSGPDVAVAHYRNMSFVSGLVLQASRAQENATDRWDGSEMYQTFLACRIIASGRSLIELAEPLIRKDIQIPGETADSYARQPKVNPCPIVERPIPLSQMGGLVSDAIGPYAASAHQRLSLNAAILRQLMGFSYPFWLLEYRRVQSWRFSAGIALGMRPRRVAGDLELSRIARLGLGAMYLLVTAAGLLVPLTLFDGLRPWLYRLAKRARRPSQVAPRPRSSPA